MPWNKSKRIFFISTISLILFVLDRTSKYIAINKLSYKGVYLFKKILYLELHTNTGIAFSINLPKIFIILLTIAIIFFLMSYLMKFIEKKDYKNTFLFSLIIIGAMSNLFDRFIYGHVIDFINLYSLSVINLSDFYIFISIIILIFLNIKNLKK